MGTDHRWMLQSMPGGFFGRISIGLPDSGGSIPLGCSDQLAEVASYLELDLW